MIQQPSRSSHDQINTLCQPIRLRLPIRPAHNNPKRLTMKPTHQIPHDRKDLQGQLSRWGENDDPRSIGRFELQRA